MLHLINRFLFGTCLLVLVSQQTVLADELSSNLPLFIIDTEEKINADAKISGTMTVIPGSDSSRSSLSSINCDYSGPIGIKWRGNSSLANDQKKYTIETRDSQGQDADVSILGLPAGSDWVLLAPYNDISMIRDVIACDMWNEMGHWGPRTVMCEVVENGDYRGVYAFCEQIKRGADRVDISKLKETDIDGRDLTGGYIVRVDAFDENDVTFESSVPGIQPSQYGGYWWGESSNEATLTWTVYYPKKENIQPQQLAYIRQFVDNVELSFQAADYADPEKGYSQWIDVASFVDYFIHTEISMNADGYKRSSYFYKDKDKKDGTLRKFHAGPVWDYNLAYGNCNFCNANNPRSWVYEGCYTNPTPKFWSKLTQDPVFMQHVRERYAWLRNDILSLDRINTFIDQYATMLDEAKDRHFKKYPTLLSNGQPGWGWGWGWGESSSEIWYAAYSVSSYAEEIEMLKSWFKNRFEFLDQQWDYSPTSVNTISSDSYFNVSFSLNSGKSLSVLSDREIEFIKVCSLNGTTLLQYTFDTDQLSYSGIHNYDLDLNQIHGPTIIMCQARDMSFISRKLIIP